MIYASDYLGGDLFIKETFVILESEVWTAPKDGSYLITGIGGGGRGAGQDGEDGQDVIIKMTGGRVATLKGGKSGSNGSQGGEAILNFGGAYVKSGGNGGFSPSPGLPFPLHLPRSLMPRGGGGGGATSNAQEFAGILGSGGRRVSGGSGAGGGGGGMLIRYQLSMTQGDEVDITIPDQTENAAQGYGGKGIVLIERV